MLGKATITFWLFALLFIHNTSAQHNRCDHSLHGAVFFPDGSPAAGAAVYLVNTKVGMTTDSLGRFSFSSVCAEKERLRIQLLGYEEMTIPADVHDDKSIRVTLKEKVQELQTIEVQSQVLETEHAHNYATLNEQQLSETAGKSLGESLREISGVNSIQSGPGIFKPVIHGVHSQRVLILNYGIRQEGQQWGAEHAPEIDPFVASDITVIKDASSIKYGTDALGGVIVVNPPELPHDNTLGGSLQEVVQTNGRSGTISAMLEGGLKNREGWGWRVQGTGKRSGDFHAPHYSLTNTGIKELNFSAAAGYHNEKKGLEVFFSRFSSELGILKGVSISSLEDLEVAMNRQPPQYTSDFSYKIGEPRQEVSHNLLKINGHFKRGRSIVRAQYGYQKNNRKEFDIRRGDLSSIPAINLELNTHTFESEWEQAISEKRTLCLGVTGMVQKNDNIPGTKRTPFIPNFASSSAGIYGVSKFYFKNASADIGVRYDFRDFNVKGYDSKNSYYDDSFSFHNASATLGANFRVNKVSSFSSNVSAAWRPPHVAELYSIGTHQSAAAIESGLMLNDRSEVMDLDQDNFKVEQAIKFVNTFTRETDKFSASVSGYINYIANYIFLRPVGVTRTLRGVYPALHYAQTDALFLGSDITTDVAIGRGLKWTNRLSLLRASDERNHDYLTYIPPSRIESFLRWTVKQKGRLRNIFVEPKIKYVTKQKRAPRVIPVTKFIEGFENDTDPLEGKSTTFDFMEAPDAYVLINLSAGFSFKSEKVQYNVRASAENLFNTAYREYSNRFRYYADDLGRNFVLSIKCIF